ncbi:TrmB family transcriptional regulator [Patescibacteria group bacterium]
MYRLIKLLQHIGLTEKESKAYLVTLKIGTNPASTIAKYAEFNRCTTYTVLESLINKGLVLQFEKNNIKYFNALGPRCLLTYIDDKKRILTHYKSAIDDKIPEFESLVNPYQLIPNVKSYAGKDGLEKVFNEILKENKLWIWATESKKNHKFFTKYIPLYLNKYPSINIIKTNQNSIEKYHITSVNELNAIPPIKPLQCIGPHRVFILSTTENYGVEIANSDMVNQFADQFEQTWKTNK